MDSMIDSSSSDEEIMYADEDCASMNVVVRVGTDEELMHRAANLCRKQGTKTRRLYDADYCRHENKKRINKQKTPQFVSRLVEVPETTNIIEDNDKFDEINTTRDGPNECDEMEMETSRIAIMDIQERERFNSLVKNSTIIRRSYNTTRYPSHTPYIS